MFVWTPAALIEKLLADHPGATLTVVAGHATTDGLAWLARRSGNRRIRLLIGSCRPDHFEVPRPEDHDDVVAFLDRYGVEIRCWDNEGGTHRHGEQPRMPVEAWIVHAQPRPAALDGPSNLTSASLYDNRRQVTPVAESSLDGVLASIRQLDETSLDVTERIRGYVTAAKPSRHRSRTGTEPPDPMAGRRREYARSARWTAYIVGAAAVAAILFIVLRGGFGDGSDRTEPVATAPSTTAVTTLTPGTPTTRSVTTTAAVPAPSTTAPQESAVTLTPLATAYLEDLAGFRKTLDDLVGEINRVNRAWDDRDETGVTFSATQSALVASAEEARALSDQVESQSVPPSVRGIHGEPGGPIEQATRLASLAEQVLAGLRLPAPDDGSRRRAALEDFNAAAADFGSSVDRMVRYVDENAEALGLAVIDRSPTGAAPPDADLPDEAAAYVDALTRFKEVLAGLVGEMNTVNAAWDNRTDTGVTYTETASSLVDIIERTETFRDQVRDQPAAGILTALAQGPPREAALIARSAAEVLAGLRIPAPDTGSERRAALDDFNAAAEAFNASVDLVVSDVYAEASSSSLAGDG